MVQFQQNLAKNILWWRRFWRPLGPCPFPAEVMKYKNRLMKFLKSSLESLGQIQPNVAKSILKWKGFKFNQIRRFPWAYCFICIFVILFHLFGGGVEGEGYICVLDMSKCDTNITVDVVKVIVVWRIESLNLVSQNNKPPIFYILEAPLVKFSQSGVVWSLLD